MKHLNAMFLLVLSLYTLTGFPGNREASSATIVPAPPLPLENEQELITGFLHNTRAQKGFNAHGDYPDNLWAIPPASYW